MKNVSCPICDHNLKETADEQPSFCLLCGADLTGPVETKLLETPPSASYATADKITAVAKQATIYLTDKRLIVIPSKLSGFGLVGALTAVAYNKMTSKSGVISIPITHVKAIKEGRFGLLMKAIIVETTEGEMLKISVPKRKQWKEAIIKAANL